MPMAQSEVIADSSEVETKSQMNRDLEPLVDPVAPASPEIQYSGDPGGAYSPEANPAPIGPQTLIVILVYFIDLGNTESVSTFDSLIFGDVSDYYSEISYDQCSISGAVTGWYNINHTKARLILSNTLLQLGLTLQAATVLDQSLILFPPVAPSS